MKRLVAIIILATFQVVAFAQRGKVRPEWDIDGGGSHHSVDDDLWSFLFFVGLIVLPFIYIAIKGALKKSQKNTIASETNPSNNTNNPVYDGKYVKMGYSSDSPLDYEVIQAKNDSCLLETPEEVNSNMWTETGKIYSLRDIWKSEHPGLYDQIEGDMAEVIGIDLSIDERILRIRIPLKDGNHKELKLRKTKLKEGNKVEISTIIGYEMHKKGHKPMIRYDGDLFYTTKVSPVERDLAPKDSYGIKYSADSKRLLYASPSIKSFSIRKDTLVICDKAFFMSKNIKSVIIPNGIRKIGEDAFAFCPNLKFVALPNSVIAIGSGVFAGCDRSITIKIPNGERKKFEQLLPEFKDKLTEKEEIKNLGEVVVKESENITAVDASLDWIPVSDAFTLKEICDETGMFNYGDILGDEAELIGIEFADGSSTLRIAIPFKDGTKIGLKAGKGIIKGYEEGDKIKVNLIYGQEFHKVGQKSIVRYDAWESEEQKNKYLRKREGE